MDSPSFSVSPILYWNHPQMRSPQLRQILQPLVDPSLGSGPQAPGNKKLVSTGAWRGKLRVYLDV